MEVPFLQPGDLIFIRGNQGVAGPIKKLTRSPYTHMAGLVLNDTVIESQGLRRTGYELVDTYRGVADVYTCADISYEQRQKVVSFVKQEIGTKYDYLLICWMACRYIIGDVVPLIASKKRRICTTLWADAYRAAGIELCPDIEHPSPGELSKSKYLKFVGSF